MLLSILANLIAVFNLIGLPAVFLKTIDISGLSTSTVSFIATDKVSAPIRLNQNSLGMKITAPSAIIIDEKSGAILWQKNPEAKRSLASISKLITALVFLDHNPGWDKKITMQKSDHQAGTIYYLSPGETLTVRDLFYSSLVASNNDATVALARSTGLAKDDFVKQMNLKAAQLGMVNSSFLEPTGLNPGNLSTAADVAKLAQAALTKPEITLVTNLKEYHLNIKNNNRRVVFKNTDKLLSGYLNVVSGKTGFIDEAGYCLTARIVGSENQTIIVAVMGSATEADRFQEVKALAQWAFDNYQWP